MRGELRSREGGEGKTGTVNGGVCLRQGRGGV